MHELNRKTSSNPLIRTVFETVPDTVLVGGYLRDALSGDKRCKDYDFVLSSGVKAAVISLQARLGGTVVDLGKKEGIIRLALKGGRHLDFSRMKGSMLDDLARRDFTVNALAWTANDGLIDPHGGEDDILRGVIRAISEKNLTDDPLRQLRAYRFSAEKGWRIEPRTRGMVRRHARLIRKVAPERITVELFHTIQAAQAGRALGQCLEDGLLEQIIPINNSELHRNVQALSELGRQIEKLPQRIRLKKFPQELSYSGLLALERLAIGVKPIDLRLSLSRPVESRLQRTSDLFNRFRDIARLDAAEVFGLFSDAGDASVDLLVLTGNVDMYPALRRFERIQSRPLLDATELMAALGLKQGPEVGRALENIKRMQYQNIIKNKREALSKLKQLRSYRP